MLFRGRPNREATGVYHENLCHFLYDNNEQVSVELAQKVKCFSKSFNQKSKTDKKDAKLIALYGQGKRIIILGFSRGNRYSKLL